MKFFEIQPPGLEPDDEQAIERALESLSGSGQDFVMHYWVKRRQLLLLVQYEGGGVFDWHLMPCATVELVPELLSWWVEQVSEDVRERDQAAASATAAALSRFKKV